MAFLLNIILIIVLCAIFAFVFTVFGIFRSIYNFKKKFNDLTSGGKGREYRKNCGNDGNSNGNQSRSNGFSYHGRTSGSDGQEIIDSRNPNEVNRKIFSDNEGEYVDFEEEK